MTTLQHHTLDQSEAAIRNGLEFIKGLTDAEYQSTMMIYGPRAAKIFGKDWPVIKALFDLTRGSK